MGASGSAPFDYTAVTPEAIRHGCETAMREAEALVAELVAIPAGRRRFANTLQPLEEIGALLDRADGRYAFLSQVSPDPALRDTAHDYQERLETFATGLGFREEIYRALCDYAATAEAASLDDEAARLLAFSLRDYRRNGLALPPEPRRRLQQLRERLVSLGVAFRRNIDEYEDALLLRRDQLAGLPDSYVDRLRREQADGETRYRVSLDSPELLPFLENADDAALREELFRKNHNKAADNNNLELLEETIALRDEIAATLGYPSWAAYMLEIRGAKTPQASHDFLVDLEGRVRVKARADMELLAELQQRHLGNGGPLQIWDWRYYTQRLRRERYQIDPFAVAEYFPLDAVLDGLFAVYQALVGVRFLPRPQAHAWAPDVRLFDIVEEGAAEPLGHFYMDLHPRSDKFGHAAAFTLQSGRRLPDGAQERPISAIVANFTTPTPDQPSLLQHSEVITLFHEFGHILHQTLSRSRFLRFAGTRVERDFVEAPSQMLEHWCWQPDVLRSFARHHRSGDPLPPELVQRLVAAKHLSSGIATLRQIYFSRLDLAYHAGGARKDTDALAAQLHPITGFPFPAGTHFQAGFGHLFGYDAGYYGYLWAKVFGDDMFTRFEAAGLRDHRLGRDYRRLILEPGGSLDGEVLVKRFLGRDPTPDAFLRDLGLAP